VIERLHYNDMTNIMPSVPNWLRIGTAVQFCVRVTIIGVCSVARNLVAIWWQSGDNLVAIWWQSGGNLVAIWW
jgi:hypothetical protein